MALESVQHLEHATEHAVEQAVGHATGHAAAGGHGGIPELPNVITVLNTWRHDHPVVMFLHRWENVVFSGVIALLLCAIAWRYARRPQMIPQGGQNLLEVLVGGVDSFVQSVIGRAGRVHTPFIGTLFLYIWFMNLSSLIPGMKPATSSLNTTVALALVVFAYVQVFAIRANGILGYLDHLAGSPRGVIGWALVPLMLPLHVLGEVIKPLSLSLRLAFNVFAEDVLLAVLVGLGIAAGALLSLPLPLQLFVVPLVLIFSTVQALVFSLLSSVYIALMVPHGDHHGAHAEAESAAHAAGH